MNYCKAGYLPTRPLLLSALLAGGLILLASTAVFPSPTSAQGVDVRITELDCNGNPELIAITNFGDTEVSMTGWNLQSDPTTEESLPLQRFGSLDPNETLLVESGPSAEGALVWSQQFVFRDNDTSDFAQLASDAREVLLKVNCGTPSQPTGTPASTRAPAVTPTALPVSEAPTGGGAPAGAAGVPPAILIAIGSALSTAGLGTFSLPLVGRLRRGRQEEEPDPHPPALPPAEPERPTPPQTPEALEDPLRPYLFLALFVLILTTVAVFLLQPEEKGRA